jgi:tetratricopeptide (TPR) repeat protein
VSIGIQCKHYIIKKFTLATVTKDVEEADMAKLNIEHLTFATTAPSSADLVRKVHEFSEKRRKTGKFTVSVEYWNAIQAHIRMFPEVGRAFIPGFPGGTLLDVKDSILKVATLTEEQTASSQQNFDLLHASQADIRRQLNDVLEGNARSWTPDPRGNEADPGVVTSLNFVRDRLREGKTRDARQILDELGDPGAFRDAFSRFRSYTNAAAIELLEGHLDAAATGFLKAFQFARDEEKAHINRVHAFFLQNKFEAAEVTCEESLVQFPSSAPLWGMRLHIRQQLGKEPEEGTVPQEVRETADYLFSLARIHSNNGDHASAIALYTRCIELDGGSLDSRRCYLAEALAWVGEGNVAAFFGHIPPERRVALEDALNQFEPLEETLAAIQSVHVSEELATNVTSSLTVLGELERARSIAVQLLGRHPNLEQLLRIRLVELTDNKDLGGLKKLTSGRLDSLPALAIVLLAEASANLGDFVWNAEIEEVAAKRSEEDGRLRQVAPMVAIAAWEHGDKSLALQRAREYVAQNPNHILGHIVAAKLFSASGKTSDSKREAQACIALLSEQSTGAENLQVADLLSSLGMYSEAAVLYERYIKVPSADELTVKWLQCLVFSDQRKKVLLAIEELAPEDRSNRTLRNIEINLAARMMDWKRMRDLLELELAAGPLRPDVAIGFGTALYRLNDIERLREFAATDPMLEKARIDQELEFSKLQVAAGLPVLGLRRLFRLFRAHPNSVQVAGILVAQALLAKPADTIAVPGKVGPGTAVELSSGAEHWWIAIDDTGADPAETWPELVSSTAPVAQKLAGAGVGEKRLITRGITSIEAEVLQIISLFAYSLRKAHELIALTPGSNGPIWSVRIIRENGQIDIDTLLQQARKRKEHVEAAFALYREQRIPIGLLAQIVGSNPINLRWEWPSRDVSLFVGLGSEDERQAAFEAIERKGQRFVTDIFTITELLLQKTGQAVVATIGRPLLPEAQRQLLLAHIQELPEKHVAAMQERNGRLLFIEQSDQYRHRREKFLRSLVAFVDEHCEVVATAGPEKQSTELRKLLSVLDYPSGECVLLCLEKNAALLSEDGGLRMLAGQVGVTTSSGLQPVWMMAVKQHHLSQKIYSDCLAAKLLGNHDFVSFNGQDLMELACRKPGQTHPAIKVAFETLRSPTLEFRSGVNVCMDFLSLAVRKLPPSIVGRYARKALDALLHGRGARKQVLERVFASRLNVYGRNGRRIPPHVRRLFGEILSRHHLRH